MYGYYVETCKHVVFALFHIAYAVRIRMHNSPCTSQPCQCLSVKKFLRTPKSENISLRRLNIGSNNPNRRS